MYVHTHNHTHTTHSTNQLLLGTCIHMLQSVTHAHTSAPVHHLTGAWTSIARIRALPKDIKIHVTIKLCAYAYVCGLPRAAVAKIPIQTISFISARSGIRSWANIKVRYWHLTKGFTEFCRWNMYMCVCVCVMYVGFHTKMVNPLNSQPSMHALLMQNTCNIYVYGLGDMQCMPWWFSK